MPYVYNVMLHGQSYVWFEEQLGWTGAICYSLLSGLNVESAKAKCYFDQGAHMILILSSLFIVAECHM